MNRQESAQITDESTRPSFASNPQGSRPLRIAILAHNSRVGGGLSVARNLLASLAKIAPWHTYLVTVPYGSDLEKIVADIPNGQAVRGVEKPTLLRSWAFDSFRLRGIVRRFAPDMIVGMGNRGIPNPPCPQAIQVKDAHFFYPSKFFGPISFRGRMIVWYHKHHLRKVLPQTDLLICQTNLGVERMREAYGYHGQAYAMLKAMSDIAKVGDVHALIPQAISSYDQSFRLLCLSRYYPQKNLESIVKTFDRYRDDLDGVVVFLTIAENQHPNVRRLLRTIRDKNLQEQIVNVGPLGEDQIGGYYRACNGVLFPTTLESFTGAYLEGMYYERPILTSDLDFAHHICGDAAVFFDPWDVASMRDAILRLRDEPGLADALVHKSKERLKTAYPSWDQIASQLIEHIERIVAD